MRRSATASSSALVGAGTSTGLTSARAARARPASAAPAVNSRSEGCPSRARVLRPAARRGFGGLGRDASSGLGVPHCSRRISPLFTTQPEANREDAHLERYNHCLSIQKIHPILELDTVATEACHMPLSGDKSLPSEARFFLRPRVLDRGSSTC